MYNKEKLAPYLQDIEDRLVEAEETALYEKWVAFANLQGDAAPGTGFHPAGRTPRPPKIEWPDININDALEDIDLMLISQFKICSDFLAKGSNRLLNVRPNYGVGIVPSLFDVKPFIMPYEMNCLPNVISFSDPEDAMERIIAADIPDLEKGHGKNVFLFGEMLKEIFADYPKIAQFIYPEHPDSQGPMDICELLLGSEMFMILYDDPDTIKELLLKLSQTYIAFLKKWFAIFPPRGYHSWFGHLHRGNICVRNDSAMNLSPAFYEEFILPYDSIVLEAFEGGAIHFCGTGDHFIHLTAQTTACYSVDVSQPHLNDMDIILEHTIGKGLTLTVVEDDFVENFEVGKLPYHCASVDLPTNPDRPIYKKRFG